MSKARLWLERIGIALIAVASLSAPFVCGLVYYLGVTDGIEFNVGDPLRESRLWMIKARRGPTGIGWQFTVPIGGPQPGVQCARSQLFILNWSGGVSLDASASYCKCYEASARGGLKELPAPCQ